MFRYLPGLALICIFLILILIGAINGSSDKGYLELLRYDKYPVYMSILRLIVITLVLVIFGYIVKKSSDGILGKMYPTNLFFLFLIGLQGVLKQVQENLPQMLSIGVHA